ncbi:LLM class flavin-dependent oxidoreductase [Planctomonas psychrotolerans]|uniref:LLM class flavin-dependent oxidoreductase n=1 Tax=Planctomonas psychrotolerans TaxID=2528712 RepID=UPI001D0CF520|nr:LLM class flavin-dependent oxidoreductase [Planctomonas psychrotolerans]
MTRPLSFNLFEMNTVGHISHGMWRAPGNTRSRYTDLDFWTDEARLLEEGLFDAVFLADVLGAYDGYRDGPETALREAVQIPNNDPLLVIPAMAAVTTRLGFVATFSTTYEPPFPFARRASTLDHLTKGRFGWNVVTSYLPNAARNFGLADELSHAERYARADEYLDVLYQLWEGSWADDAVRRDADRGVYSDPDRVRRIDHDGTYFRVAGPHLSEPSAQRTPVIYQAGSSPAGRAFAAKHAEAVFVGGSSLGDFAASIADIKGLAERNGRGPDAVRTLGSAVLIAGRTRSEAERRAAEYETLASAEGYLAHAGGGSGIDLAAYPPETPMSDVLASIGAGRDASTAARYAPGSTVGDALRAVTRFDRGPFFAMGTGDDIADAIDGWVRDTGIDGFNLRQFTTPGTVENFVEYVVPALQERGLYRTAYEPGTLRERLFGEGVARLPAAHPGAAHRRPATP